MSIYDVPVRDLMKRFIGETNLTPGKKISKATLAQWFRINYPRIKPNTVTAQITLHTTNHKSRVYYGATVRNDLFFQTDSGTIRLYEPLTDPGPIYANGADAVGASTARDIETPDDASDVEEPVAEGSEFAYESDLKNYLAANLTSLETGLRLFDGVEGISGIEFPAGGRYIDILAIDQAGGIVVIELKVSRGYDRVVGQILRYMSWVKLNLATNGERVRGIIIAKNISKDLLLACSGLNDISLYEYQLSVSLSPVGQQQT